VEEDGMDGSRFDNLTKTLAAGVSRRGVVRGALGGLAGAALAALGRKSAEAQPKGGPANECKVGCSGFNRQAKVACERACRECGGDIDRVCADFGPFGPTAFVCCPPGTFCAGEGVCCEEGTEPCFQPDGSVTCCPAGTFCDFETGACTPDCTAEHNFCTGTPGRCGDDPDCICSNTSVGIVCHHLSCAACADCASDAECRDQGFGAASVCIPSDDCCGGGSSCLTPCDQACDAGVTSARQRSYGP
jgi:hypothetical protein